MKIIDSLLIVIALFFATPAFSAGTMTNVSQKISAKSASITTGNGSTGASVNAPGVSAQKAPGSVTIGEIVNSGTMKNISQDINMDKAKISANGGAVTIGRIENK